MYKRFNLGVIGKIQTRLVLIAAAATGSVFMLYFWRLATLTPGLSPAEAAARGTSATWHLILNDPSNAPYKVLQHLLLLNNSKSLFLARLASAVLASLFVYCFWALCKDWFGKLIGLGATVLLATMPLVIILARSATPDIMYLALLPLMLAYRQFTKPTTNKNFGLILLVATAILSLYTPGLIWLNVAGLMFTGGRILESLKAVKLWVRGVVGLLGLGLLMPLAWGAAKDYHVLLRLLLLPTQWQSVTASLKSVAWMALSLFWRAPTDNPLILGRIPILNLTMAILTVFGLYALWYRLRKAFWGTVAVLGLTVVAAGLSNNFVVLTLALPALGLAIATGLRYLYVEWRGVFPRNPLPKTLAIFLIALLVGMNAVYGCDYSLRAWPHSLATKQLYVIK